MDIYVCRGLPASGKSTHAKKLVKQSVEAANGQACRLNKDDLREMLHCGVYTKENEMLVREIWKAIIKACIRNERTLIIDDCNLNPLHIQLIKKIANICSREYKVPVKLKRIDFKTDVEECIKRDNARVKPVGAKAIKEMSKQYNWNPKKKVTS